MAEEYTKGSGTGRGGWRGGGRPKGSTGHYKSDEELKKTRSIRLTDSEYTLVLEYIKQLRSN